MFWDLKKGPIGFLRVRFIGPFLKILIILMIIPKLMDNASHENRNGLNSQILYAKNHAMKEFFKVQNLRQVMTLVSEFPRVGTENIPLNCGLDRILAKNISAGINLPDFSRATMDGYAVNAASTFGASEANPAYLDVTGAIGMGELPNFAIGPGEAAKISTGGMLPNGADAVIMIEHTEALDLQTIEVYKSVAPGQNMIDVGEDFKKDQLLLSYGKKIRPQEIGLLAAMGIETICVFKKPVVGIISTGDEIIPISETPGPGQIRDINTYSLSGLVQKYGGIPKIYGITTDNLDKLSAKCVQAFSETDMTLISGGSSVGTRDFTISALSSLPEAVIRVHGISISPGKPTILAQISNKPFWGLPGHVVSAMVVFEIVVRPFLDQLSGMDPGMKSEFKVPAILSRNIASAQGRTDFVRVKLSEEEDVPTAQPVLGKSGLINTMVHADGLIEIDENSEGLDKGTRVDVKLI